MGNSRLGGSAAKGEETEVSLRMLERGQAVVRVIREGEKLYIIVLHCVVVVIIIIYIYTNR